LSFISWPRDGGIVAVNREFISIPGPFLRVRRNAGDCQFYGERIDGIILRRPRGSLIVDVRIDGYPHASIVMLHEDSQMHMQFLLYRGS
jgi:hypothetical protein